MTPKGFLGVSTTDRSEPLWIGGESRDDLHGVRTVGLDFDHRIQPIEVPAKRVAIGCLPDQDCASSGTLEISIAESDLPLGLLCRIHLCRRYDEESASLREVCVTIAMLDMVQCRGFRGALHRVVNVEHRISHRVQKATMDPFPSAPDAVNVYDPAGGARKGTEADCIHCRVDLLTRPADGVTEDFGRPGKSHD